MTSKDGGDSWQSFNDGLPTQIAYQIEFSQKNPGVAYVVTNTGLYKRELVTGLDNRNLYDSVIKNYELIQNHPNPFNSQTQIAFRISRPAYITIIIYNVTGEEIVQLVSAYFEIGMYKILWNGLDGRNQAVPSGIYWYQLKDDQGNSLAKKMVYVK